MEAEASEFSLVAVVNCVIFGPLLNLLCFSFALGNRTGIHTPTARAFRSKFVLWVFNTGSLHLVPRKDTDVIKSSTRLRSSAVP
jgi:hypothetical protein